MTCAPASRATSSVASLEPSLTTRTVSRTWRRRSTTLPTCRSSLKAGMIATTPVRSARLSIDTGHSRGSCTGAEGTLKSTSRIKDGSDTGRRACLNHLQERTPVFLSHYEGVILAAVFACYVLVTGYGVVRLLGLAKGAGAVGLLPAAGLAV